MEAITTFLSQTVLYATVYTLVSLGILIGGRAGIFNIFGEGILLTSASSGLIVAAQTQNWFFGFLMGGSPAGPRPFSTFTCMKPTRPTSSCSGWSSSSWAPACRT